MPLARSHNKEAAKRFSGQLQRNPLINREARQAGIKCNRHGKPLHSVNSKPLRSVNSKLPRSRVGAKGRTGSASRVMVAVKGRAKVRVRDETGNL